MHSAIGLGALRPAPRRRRAQSGQMIVLFSLALIAILAMAGLLVDGGMAWVNRRQAQAAADTASLAAAFAASKGTNAAATARAIAAANGFPVGYTDCAGVSHPTGGVVVNRPPLSGPHTTAADPSHSHEYVEVITTRAMQTAFAGVVGQSCWLVSARAVSSIASSAVATCNLCILSDGNTYVGGGDDETLGIDNGADLRVDGDIKVNQDNWYSGGDAVTRCGANPCTPATCSDWPVSGDSRIRMCGRSIYIAHSGGATTSLVSAKTISVNGGWQTQSYKDVLTADVLAPGCVWHPEAGIYPRLANVCIGMPKIPDPLNDPADPGNIINPPDPDDYSVPVAGVGTCPASDPPGPGAYVTKVPTGTLGGFNKLVLTGAPADAPYYTICPGIYYGGFSLFGDNRNVHVRMVPGVYYMVGGGFQVTGTASIDGSAGVMIYNTGSQSFRSDTLPRSEPVPTCPPASGLCRPLTAILAGSPNPADAGTPITYTMTLTSPTAAPAGGTVAFYDGEDLVAGCGTRPLVPVVPPAVTKAKATCTTTYSTLFGTRWLTAVYSGDSIYAPIGATLKQIIKNPGGPTSGEIEICTGLGTACNASGACMMVEPCNQVLLHSASAGDYPGVLIFQDRASGAGITLWPSLGADACTDLAPPGSPPSWMTAGVPGYWNASAPVPNPCGPFGGLEGTIYAPHTKTAGVTADRDVTISIRTSGVANLQIITARLSIIHEADTRFIYKPGGFANGKIHLVE